MVLLYGLYVPDWSFDASNLSMTIPTLREANSQTVSPSADPCEALYLNCALQISYLCIFANFTSSEYDWCPNFIYEDTF